MAYDDALEDDERDLNTGRDDHDEDDDAEDRDDGRGQDEGRADTDDDAGGEDDDHAEESAEERRRARAEQRKRDKERRQQARERDRRLIDQQAQRIAQLEAAVGSIAQRTDMGQLEGQLSQAQETYQRTMSRLREAIEGGDVDQQIKLQDELYTARRRVDDLSAIKERATQQARQPQPSAQPNTAAQARVAAYRDAFLDENSWFDPNFGDNDSRIAGIVSDQLIKEGVAADTPAHWRELKARLRQQMPHRFGGKSGATTQRPASRSPVGGSGGGGRPAASDARERQVPREYREMLEQSGDWADPKRRRAMIDEYFASAKRHGV